MFDFQDFIGALDGDEFEEIPVDIETFVTDPSYLGEKGLSREQYRMVRATTQIFRKETLIKIYGEEKGAARWKETHIESIFMLGKGSGKDYCSEVSVAYVVYQLMCLRSPQAYYGLGEKIAIDIINIAINADQASRVFFKGFRNLISKTPWFAGKYDETKGAISFDKEITVYSGHSEREAWEGYNTFMVVLDEISGFAIDNNTGNAKAKTGQEIYDMYSASITSRHPEFGKLVLLSWPRFKDDFISQRYNKVVGEKQVVIHTERLTINPEFPDDMEGNYVEFEWEEDHIISYTEPNVFALRRPSWIMNPLRKIEDYTAAFAKNKTDALMRFACMAPDSTDGLFKDSDRVKSAFSYPLKIEEDGTVKPSLQPEDEKQYYIHVDLAQKVDRCAVAMAHVDSWKTMKYKGIAESVEPVVIVDFIRFWTPSSDKTVDFQEVRKFIVEMARRGFNIRLVTFDRWNSVEMMEYLEAQGMKTERLSVAKQHYLDLLTVVNEQRLHAPDIEIVRTELMQLQVKGDKVDHPRSGSKDLADATCGAVYNAISLTPKENWGEVDIVTLDDLRSSRPVPLEAAATQRADGPMPSDLAAYLDGMSVL